jgi:DNA-directed RNA polymerase specialized sigma24 family protein
MSEPAHIQVDEQQANLNATGEGVRETSSKDLHSLYQLSFLLTRDHDKAERCFVVGIEHLLRGNRAFNQWAHAWSKRIVVENAIREVKPRPGIGHSYSSALVFPYGGQLSTPPGGHFEPEAILALEDFERFVFVLSVLDHYSEQDCALFLDCSVLEIRETRTRALEKLIDSLHIAFVQQRSFRREDEIR